MKTKDNREFEDSAYSNFDHTFEYGFKETEKMIKENSDKFFGHSAWNFCGYIWFENDKFYEEVWCYQIHNETFENENLRDLIENVNMKYGYD